MTLHSLHKWKCTHGSGFWKMTLCFFSILLYVLLNWFFDIEGLVSNRIITESTMTLYRGTTATLPCRFDGQVYAVYWSKGRGPGTAVSLVYVDAYYKAGERGGPGYEDGMFNMTNDYALIINNVTLENEGRYICQVSDRTSGRLVFNFTDATVVAIASGPVITQCTDVVGLQRPDNFHICVYDASRNGFSLRLDCSLSGFKPNVSDFIWTSSGRVVSPAICKQRMLTDGTFQKNVSINVDLQDKRYQIFTCSAKGKSVTGGISNSSVIVISPVLAITSPTMPVPEYNMIITRNYKNSNDDGKCVGFKTSFSISLIVAVALFVTLLIKSKGLRKCETTPEVGGTAQLSSINIRNEEEMSDEPEKPAGELLLSKNATEESSLEV